MNHTKKIVSRNPSRKLFHGFTLVELIVVITILAILGTIGFISIGGYSSKARDSSRVSDLANISKSLDISIITVGNYPTPDNSFTVTFSGGTVWTQGTIGSMVLQVFRSSIGGGGLSKKPVDPLKNAEYVYSSLAEGKAYQLKADYEGDIANATAYNDSDRNLTSLLVDSVSAESGNPTTAYIRGNYGGLTAKVTKDNMIYVLAIPSIITNSGSTTVEIKSNSLSGTLLFNGKPLVKATTYNPNTAQSGGVVYSVSTAVGLPQSSTDAGVTSLVTNLKAVYGSTPDIASNTSIATLLSASGTTAIQSLGGALVSNQLGGKISSSGGNDIIDPIPPAQAYSSSTAYVAGQSFIYSGATISVTLPGRGVSDSKFLNCSSNDVVIWADGDTAPIVLSLCNVGATTPFTGNRSSANDNPNANTTTGGRHFLGGENIAWDISYSYTNLNNCTWDRDNQECISGGGPLSNWTTTYSDNISGGSDRWFDWSQSDKRGPCAIGYHVPSYAEWLNIYVKLGSDRNTFSSALKLPMTGYHDDGAGSGRLNALGSYGYYWSSSPSTSFGLGWGKGFSFDGYGVYITGGNENQSRSRGYSVRCIRN